MTLSRLQDLRRITDAVATARQAEMAALRRQEEQLLQSLRQIEADRAEGLATLDPEAPAVRAGAVMTWQGWVDAKRAGTLSELATLRARMMAARERLGLAHGRDQALGGVSASLSRQAATLAQRRQDNGAG